MPNELNVTPTKGSLIAIQKSLELSTLGFDLLDRKRNILIREMMLLIDQVKSLRGEISQTYRSAYEALQEANVTLGIVQETAMAVPIEDGVTITYRSVMVLKSRMCGWRRAKSVCATALTIQIRVSITRMSAFRRQSASRRCWPRWKTAFIALPTPSVRRNAAQTLWRTL